MSKPFPFKPRCEYCDQTFESYIGLREHQELRHYYEVRGLI